MKAPDTYSLILDQLVCYLPDESDGDEIFLKMNGEKIWPKNKAFEIIDNGTIELEMELKDLKKIDKVVVELWDYDLISRNDHLGNFEFVIDKPGGPFNTDLMVNLREGNSARYNLKWHIVT